MQCTSCHHQAEDPEALFCAQCGKSLRREGHCYFCGKPFTQHANYCDRCGIAVDAVPTEISRFFYPPDLAILLEQVETINTQIEQDDETKAAIEAEVKRRVTEAQVERSIERSIQKEKAHQAKLLKYGMRESDWAGISGGKFLMGSPATEKDRFDNELQHEIEIDRFEILKTPVTFEMFDIFCDEVRHTPPPDETWGRENRPVINVTYWSAVEYCHWLSKRTKTKVRLPTEAEWEFACRADTTTPFWTGETISPEQANFDGNYTYGGSDKGPSRGQTTPVDMFTPNPWGLHDMHGNVWEWCASVFDEGYTGLELKNAGYDQDNLEERVVRGGSWHNVPSGIRSASRNKLRPNYHYLRVGFRIVREIT